METLAAIQSQSDVCNKRRRTAFDARANGSFIGDKIPNPLQQNCRRLNGMSGAKGKSRRDIVDKIRYAQRSKESNCNKTRSTEPQSQENRAKPDKRAIPIADFFIFFILGSSQ